MWNVWIDGLAYPCKTPEFVEFVIESFSTSPTDFVIVELVE